MRKWEKLPPEMQTEEVRKYYDILKKRKLSRFFKRATDIVVSFIALVILLPLFLVLATVIKVDSRGSVFFRQERVTRYNEHFRIFKFRTMVTNAEKLGASVTSDGDSRITRAGKFLRKCKLDELPQFIDVLRGKMTLVGTRPEVPAYVAKYTSEMYATLLMPAGITSMTSVKYKDEALLIESAENADEVYINEILPAKMEYNLQSLEKFSYWGDIKTVFITVFVVLKG